MPSDTPAKGDVGPSDITVSGSGGGAVPPASGGGLRNLSKGQKYGLAAGVAVVIGIGVDLYAKNKSASAAAATTAANTTTAPAANGIVGETPQYDGQGSVGGGGGSNLSNLLTQLFNQQDQSIAADIAGLNTTQGQQTIPGNPGENPGGVMQPATNGAIPITSTTTGPGLNVASSNSSSAASAPTATLMPSSTAPTVYSDLSPSQANQLVSSGAATPAQALADEVPAAIETPAERHQQEIANKSLRAAAKG